MLDSLSFLLLFLITLPFSLEQNHQNTLYLVDKVTKASGSSFVICSPKILSRNSTFFDFDICNMHAILCNTQKNRHFYAKDKQLQVYKKMAIHVIAKQVIRGNAPMTESYAGISTQEIEKLYTTIETSLKKHAIAFVDQTNKNYHEIIQSYKKACDFFRQTDAQQSKERARYRKNNQYGPTRKPVTGFPRKR